MQEKVMSHDKINSSWNKNVALPGVSTWCVNLVCQLGVSTWCVNLVCQLVARHYLNACNISTLHVACDKVGRTSKLFSLSYFEHGWD